MKKENYKNYVDEVNKNNNIKERLQAIPSTNKSMNIAKPIIAVAMSICLICVGMLALNNTNSKPKKGEVAKNTEIAPSSRKGEDGLVYLKEGSEYISQLEISDTPLYETLPVHKFVELERTDTGMPIQNITDLISQEEINQTYVEPIERILNLNADEREITYNETETGIKTRILYTYSNGVSFSIDAYLYVNIYFDNPEVYGITDGDSANKFALNVLEEFTGNPYETYTYKSSFDIPPESNSEGYVTRSDVNDMMKSFERMEYRLFKYDTSDQFMLSLPNSIGVVKVDDVKMISTQQALENLKNDYGLGATQLPMFKDETVDYDQIIQNALNDETQKDILGIELYYSRHYVMKDYVYPSYLVLIKVPDNVETNAKPDEVACIVTMVYATELLHISE